MGERQDEFILSETRERREREREKGGGGRVKLEKKSFIMRVKAHQRQKEKEGSACTDATTYFRWCKNRFDSQMLFLRVLVSSTDICQPITLNYCTFLRKLKAASQK